GLDPEGEPAPVVDLRAWARGGDPAPGRRRARPRTFADTPPPAEGADGERGTAAAEDVRPSNPPPGDTLGGGHGERGTSDTSERGARGGRRSGGRWSGGGGAGGGRRPSEASGKGAGSRAERERREL